MGQVLTGEAPAQILPVEHYLSEKNYGSCQLYEYESSLGSTRFFKVARASCKEGLVVVKVFVINDPSLPLERHRRKLEDIAVRLKGLTNCLPFQKCKQNEKSAMLIRQYVKHSLYDRISTRPFLSSTEKCWIAFQLLCALNQCHKAKVCHGDIKSENVLLTSWNWLLLTDFASFKPVYLPEDNPSDFSYFFDTSRRRTCYIAPERFEKSSTLNVEGDLKLTECKKGELTPKMDIFSAGCVITELFTDGNPPFDLSRLLAYHSGDYSPWKVIDSIQGQPFIKELVSHMLQKDPEHRLSAEEYLVKQRAKAFPDIFYTTLKSFEQHFIDAIIPGDDKILHLAQNFDGIMKGLQIKPDNPECNEVLVLIISLVASVSRDLHFSKHRLLALDILCRLSCCVTVEQVLNRILPVVLFFLKDEFPVVRARAVRSLTAIFEPIREVPDGEANIFPEYIFPVLNSLVADEEASVRMEYARCIAFLAEAALRILESMHRLKVLEHEHLFLEQELDDGSEDEDKLVDDDAFQENEEQSYDCEMSALQEMVQKKVVVLLNDPDNAVKIALIDGGDLGRLCLFFGQQKACDVLLSHMITFLNDKVDWQLRASFFTAVTSLAGYIGWQSTYILQPLLQQGLIDCEEFVIQRALSSLQKIVTLGFLTKPVLLGFVNDIVPLLAHPNDWIRQGSVGFISTVAGCVNIADLHVDILPRVSPFLDTPITQLSNEVVLLNSLGEAVPRPVLELVLRFFSVGPFFEMLRLRHEVRPAHWRAPAVEGAESLNEVLHKLQHRGLTETLERKLLAMREFISKLHQNKSSVNDSLSNKIQASGRMNIRDIVGYVVTRRHADLHRSKGSGSEASVPMSQGKKSVKQEAPSITMNPEWKKMFGAEEMESSPPKLLIADDHSAVIEADVGKKPSVLPGVSVSRQISGSQVQLATQSASTVELRTPEVKSSETVMTRFSPCKYELRDLVHYQRACYDVEITSRDLAEGIMFEARVPPDNWRPKGILVAHLQEHKAGVNRLCVSPDHKFFGSCSSDGTVRLWEVARLEGKTVANRSQIVFGKQSSKVKCVTFCGNSNTIAASSNHGGLHVYSLDSSGGYKPSVIDYGIENCGPIMDMTYYGIGGQGVLLFATVQGHLIGWDLRAKSPAFIMKHGIKSGIITALSVHKSHAWSVVGTSAGHITVWDMRFRLSIGQNAPSIKHHSGNPVRRLVMHPCKSSWFASAVGLNNEVSVWDAESMMRQEMLWASDSPPFSADDKLKRSVRALYLAASDTHTFALTGGTDKCVRYWDLKRPATSFIVNHGHGGHVVQRGAVSYLTQLIDGCVVTKEVVHDQKTVPDSGSNPSISLHDAPASGHLDAISDLVVCQGSQCLVVSAAYNGHIKVWK